MMAEYQIKVEKSYISDNRHNVSCLQVKAIKKIGEDYRTGKLDLTTFFNRLTFSDNTYYVNGLDSYEIGDENDFVNDDAEYSRAHRNRSSILNDNEGHNRGNTNNSNGVRVQRTRRQNQSTPLVEETVNQNIPGDCCVVCLLAKKDTIVEPCDHLKFCFECIKTLHGRTNTRRARQPKSPLCRVPIANYKRVFM